MTNRQGLSGIEYDQLGKDALNLLIDYGFIKFPIDVFDLAIKAFGAKIIKYSSLEKEKLGKIKGYDETKDGFTVTEHLSDGTIRYTIYYDDKSNPSRQRYTIGHEIKHLFYQEENPSKKDEEGAEYFSKVLIAPKCLIIKNNIKTVNEIENVFGLSYEASYHHLNGINNRRKRYGNELFDYEQNFINDMNSMLK